MWFSGPRWSSRFKDQSKYACTPKKIADVTGTLTLEYHCINSLLILEVSLKMSISCTDCGDLYRCDLDPRRHITLDRIRLKLNFRFNHAEVSGNDTLVFSEINSASLWKKRLVSLLIPPLDEKTRGVNVPYSSFNIRSMYFLFFFPSIVFIVAARLWFL